MSGIFSSYILVNNDTGIEVCSGTEEQIRGLFIEQNEREYARIANRTYKESQNRLKAEAIINGGEGVFREIALGKCYFSILKMIENQQITHEQGTEFMRALELYAYNFNFIVPVDKDSDLQNLRMSLIFHTYHEILAKYGNNKEFIKGSAEIENTKNFYNKNKKRNYYKNKK